MRNSDLNILQEKYIQKSREFSESMAKNASYEHLQSIYSELQSIYNDLEQLSQQKFIQLRLDIS